MDSEIYRYLMDFGFLGILAIAFAEKLIPILPSYLMLEFLGATQASTFANLAIPISASACGSMLGAMFWYCVGRHAGRETIERLIARFGRYFFLSVIRYEGLVKAYVDNQFWTTLVAQTIPTIRIFLAVPAGVLKLDLRSFLPATGLGILLWNTPLIIFGYVLRGTQFDLIQIGLTVVAVLLLVEITVGLTVRRVKSRQ